jgi:hypothetical protein
MDIGALLKSQFPLPWGALSLALTEESTPPHPRGCSLIVLTSRDLRLLFFTDRSTTPELCLGSPAEPWRWWHVDTVAQILEQPSPGTDPDPDPRSQLARLVDFAISHPQSLAELFARNPYRANRALLREVEKLLAAQTAERLALTMKTDDPRRKWYSLRTLGASAQRRVG